MGGWARLRVSKVLLLEALHLPADTTIAGADVAPHDTVEFIVSHEHIPPKAPEEGGLLQLVTPTFHKQEPVVFEGWNPE